MEYNIFSFDLQIPCNCIREDFDYKEKINREHCRLTVDEVVDKDFIQFLKSLDIKITIVEGFRKYPKQGNYFIHKDDFDCNDRAKLNYLLEDQDSYMVWYKSNSPGFIMDGATGAKPVRYFPWNVDLLHTAKVKKPSVIQSQIPHDIINPNSVRYNLAISIRDSNTDGIITYAEAYNRFKDYLM